MKLELNALCAGYGGGTVLNGISARFEIGELSVIVGRNGAGKSTMLRAMAGMLPAGDAVLLDGASIRTFTGAQRAARIGYLPQRLRSPDMTVQTLVSHGRFSRLGFSKALGDEDGEALGCAADDAEDEPAEPVRRADSGEGFHPGEAPDDGRVGHRIELLEDVAQHQGQGEGDDVFVGLADGHVTHGSAHRFTSGG